MSSPSALTDSTTHHTVYCSQGANASHELWHLTRKSGIRPTVFSLAMTLYAERYAQSTGVSGQSTINLNKQEKPRET